MKKIIVKMFVCILCFGLVACGSGKPSDVSDDVYDIGVKTVEVVQQYLDGDLGDLEAKRKIEKFIMQIPVNNEDNPGNYDVGTKLHDIYMAIDASSNSKILETKNDLKDYLGI